MSLHTLLATQEAILNRYLNLDPRLSAKLVPLAGKVIKIDLNYATHYWLFVANKIQLVTDYSGVIDLSLGGSWSAFFRAAVFGNYGAATSMPLQVSGDMEFAIQFKNIFSSLTIDWEEHLSSVVGDTLAYPLAQFFKSISLWARSVHTNMSQNITEYLQVEKDYLVPAEELHPFFLEVDELRDELARLEARVNYLLEK